MSKKYTAIAVILLIFAILVFIIFMANKKQAPLTADIDGSNYYNTVEKTRSMYQFDYQFALSSLIHDELYKNNS